MTTRDLYNDVWGRPVTPSRGYGFDAGINSFAGRPEFQYGYESTLRRGGPAGLPATEDERLMAYGFQEHKLADELMKRSQANKSQRSAALLKSLLQQPDVNLYGRPTNATEAEAQRLVQEHVNAQTRGLSALTTADKFHRERAMEQTDLASKQTALRNAIRDQQMAEGLYPTQKEKLKADLAKALADTEWSQYVKQSGIESKAAAIEDRRAAMAATAAQRAEQEHDKQMVEAVDMVDKGGVDPRELIGKFPALKSEDFMNLNARSQATQRYQREGYETATGAAEGLTKRLQGDLAKTEQDYRAGLVDAGFMYFDKDFVQADLDRRKAQAEAAFRQRVDDDVKAGKVRFDAGTGTFVPIPRAPITTSPLDEAMLKSKGITSRYQPAAPVPGRSGNAFSNEYVRPGYFPQPSLDNIENVSSPEQAQASTKPYLRNRADGKTYTNPNYNPRGALRAPVQPPAPRDPSATSARAYNIINRLRNQGMPEQQIMQYLNDLQMQGEIGNVMDRTSPAADPRFIPYGSADRDYLDSLGLGGMPF